ncbi:uncharacterized protein LOC142656107 [Rhinoderma darwinii]|uniref:uncharacterized protein LOC142656107 n=1 Tax=Rhinoderma darwinii TaxID=43563 RepID=UPI003F673009
MKLVGVFSREHESCYQWLITFLVGLRSVRDVRPVNITNNFQTFQDEASKCGFAILYHSKKRGRVNVTNVLDSLYDNELQYLNSVHGKKNVLVVIDDLESSSEAEKYRILTHQPSIQNLAEDLFIFSSSDKAFLNEANSDGYQSPSHPMKALDEIRKIIEGGRVRVGHVIPGDPDRGFSPPAPRRLLSNRLCWLGLIFLIAIIMIIVIIVLSVNKAHAPGTTAPDGTTATSELQSIISNLTMALLNITV